VTQYAGALLYLVPVVVAGVVAFVVSRPEKDRTDATSVDLPPVPPQRRAKDKPKPPGNVVAHPTLMHAALSTHLTAVSGTPVPVGKHRPGPAQAASLAASVSAQHAAARLVSIRRPARIPRRPVHRCPHKP
jgi:hypothetical protein